MPHPVLLLFSCAYAGCNLKYVNYPRPPVAMALWVDGSLAPSAESYFDSQFRMFSPCALELLRLGVDAPALGMFNII